MIRLRLEGLSDTFQEGIDILAEELNFQIDHSGVPIKVDNGYKELMVSFDGEKGFIGYNEKIHFFRGLGLLIEAIQNDSRLNSIEQPQFDTMGAMFDCSRNAVLTVESIQFTLRKMAVMGLNMMMLYTEDTYSIENKPFFGYMRGKYSYKELKECDEYAQKLGIEIIPCIQTLGHMEQYLKWNPPGTIKENETVLLVGEEDTYTLIEEMIQSATAPFTSKRIHIGMDETWGLGLGEYLKKHGYERSSDIFISHLNKVLEITNKYDLKPMIWSDMIFKMVSTNNEDYDMDAVIPEEIINRIPKDIQMVYWEYYHRQEDIYKHFINKHKELGTVPTFAGGILTWGSYCTNYFRTFESTNTALNVCKQEGIREVFATLWADDGCENNMHTTLLGLQLYAEQGYTKELDEEVLSNRTKFCTGIDYQAFMDLSYLDETPGVNQKSYRPLNVSKYLLWQDPLLGLFDKDIEGLDLSNHYKILGDKFREHASLSTEAHLIFSVPQQLCSVLSIKSEIGVQIKAYYEQGEKDALKDIVDIQLPELYSRISQLRDIHREQWLQTYKVFGWEVLDRRYGGLLSRIKTTIMRLTDYVEGKIDYLAELDQEKLYLDQTTDGLGTGSWKSYKHIFATTIQ